MGDYVPDSFLAASSDDMDVKPECQSNPANCSLTSSSLVALCCNKGIQFIYAYTKKPLRLFIYVLNNIYKRKKENHIKHMKVKRTLGFGIVFILTNGATN